MNPVPDATLANLIRNAGALIERLLRLAPEPGAVDWQNCRAATWRRSRLAGGFHAYPQVDAIRLQDLLEIDDQKARLLANTRQFVAGYPANNALLWGARGTGKSSLVHGLLDSLADAGLRLLEVRKEELAALPQIADRLRPLPYRFLLFCDDLSFEADDPSYKVLKSALEGSVFRTASNLLIYATSNRRHLLTEQAADNNTAAFVGGELHEGDAIDEKVSLSDRFGLRLGFHPFTQDAYLRVSRYWIETLAKRLDASLAWTPDLAAQALRWALARGVRSGRTALYFARDRVGAALLAADDETGAPTP